MCSPGLSIDMNESKLTMLWYGRSLMIGKVDVMAYLSKIEHPDRALCHE
jgi:hypothetical protein